MKFYKIIWILSGIILLFWCYYLFVSPRLFKEEEIKIPNVENLNIDEAIKILDDNSILYKISYISGENEGIVKYTVPSYDINVYKTYVIDVYVEVMPKASYPSFEGLIYKNNISLIDDFCNKYNVNYEVEYVIDEHGIDNQIIHQSIPSGTLVNEGDTLIIKVLNTNEYFNMPNLAGMNINEAIKLLSEYNFKITINYYYAPINEDLIISQEIKENTILKRNARHILYLYVSKGMPDEINVINIYDFCNILNDLNYNYDIIDVDSFESNIIVGIVYDYTNSKYIIYLTS